jgi:anaerobic magnesium-protoporphyrin IX monomethyl ester cyclase
MDLDYAGKKILLVNPIKESLSNLAVFPPIGLGYIASSLRRAGFRNVKILDCLKDNLSLEQFEKEVKKEMPSVVGFTVFSLALKSVLDSVRRIKQLNKDIIILVGGPHPSAIPQRALEDGIDYGFIGEGEKGVPMLLKYLFANQEEMMEQVPGLIYRKNGEVRFNQPFFNPEPDSIPFPAWDLIDPPEYFSRGVDIKRFTGCILITRGCPFDCSFCSVHTIAGRNLRSRSIENVLEEMEVLERLYGIRRFVILDENFTADNKFVSDFCYKIIALNKKYEFILPNGVRLDTLTRDILRLMLRAGFSRRMAVGIESGSDRVLGLMNKKLSKSVIEEKLELLAREGFRTIGYFIIGYPGETRQDIEETIRFASKVKLYEAAFTCYIPMPGTKTFDYITENEGFPRDFDFTLLNTDKINYTPKSLSKEELSALKRKALLTFYLRPRQMLNLLLNVNPRLVISKFINIFLKKT